MKKSFVSLLTIAAITFGMASCNSSKKQDAAEQKVEEEAAIAGEVSKGLLTAELKDEVTRFLKDMPDSELPYKVSTGEVTISVANTDFMLPVSKVSELNTQAQKARACGIYFADLNVLKAMKKPTTDIENVLVKLTTDLDIPFAIDIMKESAPANASKEELSKFMKNQENKLIDAMMENDKADVELELLGGMAVEYAIVYANPGLVVKGDAISAGLSENMEKHSVSRLIGAPPGYVGYEEGGQLTEAVRRKPYSVILFDEVEKAHPDVFNILLQVLDDGRITDSQGRTIDFKNTILILTSNLGSQYLLDGIDASGEISQEAKDQVDQLLKRSFRPEFLNRLDEIVYYKSLTKDETRKIVDLQLEDLRKRMDEGKHLKLDVTTAAKDFIIDSSYDSVYGARPIKRFIQSRVETLIAKAIIQGSYTEGATLTVDYVGTSLVLR